MRNANHLVRSRTVRLTGLLILFLLLCFGVEYAFMQMHLRGGRSAWFAVDVYVNAFAAAQADLPGYSEHVLNGPFASKDDCLSWVRTDAIPSSNPVCKRMRFEDAGREGWRGTAR